MDVGREVVLTTPTEHFDPATLDVLKCALGSSRMMTTSGGFCAITPRRAATLMAKLFCQNY